MKRREFLAKMGAACLLGIQIGVSGCLGAATTPGATEDQAAEATETISTASPTASATTSTSLAGTCPKGRSCTSPQCQLWSDLNGNNKCDRSTDGTG